MSFLIFILGAGFLLVLYLIWIRPWQLHWGATEEEVQRPMPGDEIVTAPSFDATRGITIEAPPEALYPWIVQMGITRAGWYSYDLLDNLGRPSAREILPNLQESFPGQLIPVSPDGKQGFYVKEFAENEWMLWWDQGDSVTWVWMISPVGEGQSRLVTRVRVRYHWSLRDVFFNLILEFCDILMMAKCMRGIKERAEAMAR
ncbi:MAG: hypothetical protein JXA13_16575 [Anaerolineales bacterium]|nr:hypothetical protein [Anaerolineales bacterium]